jgi:hypothetical protein
MNKKTFSLICIFIVIFMLAAIYYFRPIKISNIMENNNENSLSVAYIKGTEDFSNPGIKTGNFSFRNSSAEFKSICDLLTKYYYHSSVNTLLNDTSVDDIDLNVVIKNSKHTIVISNRSNITIDGVPFKVGYLGNAKSIDLTKELMRIIAQE